MDTWPYFKALLLFFLAICSMQPACASAELLYNPAWADTVLLQERDSAAYSQLKQSILVPAYARVHASGYMLQPLRHAAPPLFYLYFITAILGVALVLRLIYDDFSESLLRGVLSSKAYYVALRTNKYDSPVPLAYVFLAKHLVLGVIAYLALEQLFPSGPMGYDPGLLLRVAGLVMGFGILRSLGELLFNWVIGTGSVFKAFTLQQLFIDFIWGLLLLTACLVFIYHPGFQLRAPLGWFSLLLALYLVFNTFRSYQLMHQARVPFRLHFFIYICTFKILPVLLLAKYLVSNT